MEYFIRNDCAKLFDPQVFHGASFEYLRVYGKISQNPVTFDVAIDETRKEQCTKEEGEREKKRKRFIPWHSVRLNLLTRFQASPAAIFSTPSLLLHVFLALFHILLLLFSRSFMITNSTNSVRPTLQPVESRLASS